MADPRWSKVGRPRRVVQNADVLQPLATPPGRGGVGIGPDVRSGPTQFARAIVARARGRAATQATFVPPDTVLSDRWD